MLPTVGPRVTDVSGQPPLWAQLRVALASMLWTCAELWAWELQVFEASGLGPGNAAAYTLLSSTYSLLICMFPVSLHNRCLSRAACTLTLCSLPFR